jgi:hypothetical protein
MQAQLPRLCACTAVLQHALAVRSDALPSYGLHVACHIMTAWASIIMDYVAGR